MKSFFNSFLASLLAICVAVLIITLFGLGAVSALMKTQQETIKLKPHTLLTLDLSQAVADRSLDNQLDPMSFASMSFEGTLGLYDVLQGIRRAAKDPNIDGIVIKAYITSAGISTLGEIRRALTAFKESGKFIIAHADLFTQSSYYVSSVADQVYMGHDGIIEFKGLNSEVMFYTEALKKLGVEVQIIREGKYKSAVEPFFRTSMSDESREQISAYIDDVWKYMANDIALSRNLSVDEVNRLAAGWIARTPQSAFEAGLIDSLLYADEIEEILKTKTKVAEGEKLQTISISDYRYVPEAGHEEYTSDRIAIIYGSGSIAMEAAGALSIGADLAKSFKQARQDNRIKAVVFRVNSGGGDALASDIIRREVELTRQKKPVIVSMGDVAGSGGYMIAAPAETIVATPMTLTGSIGAFGMVPNIGSLLEDKLGIHLDGYKTHPMADAGSLTRPLTPSELKVFEDLLGNTYESFVAMVAEARGMTKEAVDAVGQGRIWSGEDALGVNLVDTLGGFLEALDLAAGKAGLDHYRVREMPALKDPIQEILNQIIGRKASIGEVVAQEVPYLKSLYELKRGGRIQTRIPFDLYIQ